MGKKEDIQRLVRQRERFVCAFIHATSHDTTVGLKQYAHVIPEADKGPYEIDNLLWACEECQRKHEPARTSPELKAALIAKMKQMRDRPKPESLVDGLFDELVLLPDTEMVVKMGAMQYINTRRPFSEIAPDGFDDPQFIEFYRTDTNIILNGLIKDESGAPLITFAGSKLQFHTADAWDFERKPRYLKIINASQQVWFSIQQFQDLSLEINGELYFNHEKLVISDAVVKYGGLSMSNITIKNGHIGLALPYTQWMPRAWASGW